MNDFEDINDFEDGMFEDGMFEDMIGDLETNVTPEKMEKLFEDAEKPLYVGCERHTKLSAVCRLFNLKATHKWSDISFTHLLEAIHEMLPKGNELPTNNYLAKKVMCPMGLEVERIDACRNDCILYRKEYANLHHCIKCKAARYKRAPEETGIYDDNVSKNGPPFKVMWYLPLIPRLKQFFANPKEARLVRWHSESRNKDGKIRHVADSPQWRNIDRHYPEFGREMRNIRFGLSSDGINPFSSMNTNHSTWPVLLCNYNLPPWLCMKKKYIMMSMLIQGPKQPGNDIDTYLAPLIDELETLWDNGEEVYDADQEEYFNLRAMIFCTISDFPAYGNLSGYSTHGNKACPVCEEDTCFLRLKHCGKTVFMGHRRYLPRGHRFRSMTSEFDGKTDDRKARGKWNVYDQVKNLNVVLGKRKKMDEVWKTNWRKRSCFWDLPYWRILDVRHCLDVMHIEKNVCDSLLGLLLNIPGKTKDGLKMRKDMIEMGIRSELHPVKKASGFYLPPACYSMSKEENKNFVNVYTILR